MQLPSTPPPVVFVVDDEPAVLRAVGRMLRGLDLDVRFFAEPATSLEAAQLQEPRLLITDMRMPGMNGLELLTALRRRWPKVEVILHTGTPPAGVAGVSILEKPASAEEFRALVTSVLPAG